MYLNGTIGINTTGIKITTNCALPSQLSVNSSYDNPSRHFEQSSGDDDPVKHLLVNISATSVEGCYWCIDDLSTFTNGKFNDTIYAEDNNDAEQSYGVTTVPGCGTNTSNPAFQTVRQSLLTCSVYIRFIPYYCLGFLLVFGSELEQRGRCFLPTEHAAF